MPSAEVFTLPLWLIAKAYPTGSRKQGRLVPSLDRSLLSPENPTPKPKRRLFYPQGHNRGSLQAFTLPWRTRKACPPVFAVYPKGNLSR
ncbi:hypothetical protein [Nostoc sp. 106C]|uniref:hypothetical protein n=1 Tax=Nostoc sp. 106C TaxID=1932667 RepID=UPI0011801E82|nr:hypothetical protein [Nostoc sp. 106C]